MKPPVEHVRVSAKGKEILTKLKRNTGIEHWNVVCRIALCSSLANQTPPTNHDKIDDNSIDIDWKVFAGTVHKELSALVIYRAQKDGIDVSRNDVVYAYFKAHLERGIMSLYNIKSLNNLFKLVLP